MTGTADIGGLFGVGFGTVTDSYWDEDASGLTVSDGGAGKTTSELQTTTDATGIYSAWSGNIWDFGTASQYPALKADWNRDGASTAWEFGSQRP